MLGTDYRARLVRGLLLAGFAIAVSGCSNPWEDYSPTLESVLSGGWLFGEDGAEREPKPLTPVYCYETIGVGDCHGEPLEDGGNRLIGFEGPPPSYYGAP